MKHVLLTGMHMFVCRHKVKKNKNVCRSLKRPCSFVPIVSSTFIDQSNSTKQWFQSPFGSFPQSEHSNKSQCLSPYAVITASDKIKTLTNRDQGTSVFVFCVNVSICPWCPFAPFCLKYKAKLAYYTYTVLSI